MVRLLRDNLTYEGYAVLVAMDGEAALEIAFRDKPDLILLDIMLPKLDGLSVCRQLREKRMDAPIIILTARNLEQDKVTGLKIGADDYMTKPFSISELLARTEASLRRTDRNRLETYSFGNVHLNFSSYTATKNGVAVELSSSGIRHTAIYGGKPRQSNPTRGDAGADLGLCRKSAHTDS
jgi:DNA-binding response OmpR family regulator